MNLLASRKKQLLAESDLNRTQLIQDWEKLAVEAKGVAQQATTFRFLASASVILVSQLIKRRLPAVKKTSWLQSIFKGAQLAGSLWMQFRSPPKPPHKYEP